jgi:hypothetical protein
MGTILALDLGKFKSVACWYQCGSGEVTFETAPSARTELKELLTRRRRGGRLRGLHPGGLGV